MKVVLSYLKIEKVKDFSSIRKEPYYSDIFNQIQGYPAPHLYKYARDARSLFIICVIVYNPYYCCYAKTSSSAVQKRHSKVYGNPIAPSLGKIIKQSKMYKTQNAVFIKEIYITNPFSLFPHELKILKNI